MDLRIDRHIENKNAVFRLGGRIQSDALLTLQQEVGSTRERIVIDMQEVTLVDVEVVKFLADCQSRGVALRNCPGYIREWISRERKAA